jgi:hypothetical protein
MCPQSAAESPPGWSPGVGDAVAFTNAVDPQAGYWPRAARHAAPATLAYRTWLARQTLEAATHRVVIDVTLDVVLQPVDQVTDPDGLLGDDAEHGWVVAESKKISDL